MNITLLPSRLTPRQKEIGSCLLKGMCLKNIARQFNISVRTVRAHQNQIQKKLLCLNAYQVGYQLGCLLNEEQKILKIYLENSTFNNDTCHF
jgi:DNA-binding NarL/FixJ family response regulator